jgi:DNA-binding CsgD family transcriptional regulator
MARKRGPLGRPLWGAGQIPEEVSPLMIVRPVICRPFVGRREELAYLQERRLAAASSHGGIVLISGDAGLGKSRLIAEFCDALAYSRWRILKGYCSEFGGRPYAPILDALGSADAIDQGPVESKHEQMDAIVARFAALTARKATILVVEDLHWADAATLELLAHLGQKVGSMRLLVLASFRSEDVHEGHPAANGISKISRASRGGRIDLTPLSGIELRAFIDGALSGFELPEETRRNVARIGEGNPFFTEELLKSAVEQDFIGKNARERELPHSIRATLLERLSPFDPEQRRVIAQSAVIGRTFGLDLLAETLASEPSRLLPILRRARDFQLIEEIGPKVFRFRHRLTREALYGDFLSSELRPLHRMVALALEGAPEEQRSIENLAYHWWAAGDGESSARYNELAGDAAGKVFAHEDAIAFYERALESALPASIARGTVLEKMAEQRFALTWTEAAQATYCEAADVFGRAQDYDREANCRVHAAVLAYTAGMPSPTAPLETMLQRLPADEELARSRVHLGLAWMAATFWFPTQSAYHLAQVDVRGFAGAPDLVSRFHNVSSWVAMTVGDIDEFRREHQAWVDTARDGPLRRLAAAHINGAMCFSFFGLHEEALANVDRAANVARESQNRYVEESARAFSAFSYLLCGDLKRARAAVEAVPTTSENHVNFTFASAWGTIVAAHLGDTAMMEKWFDGFESIGTRKLEIELGAGFAEILVRRGRNEEAARLLHRVLPECELMRGNVLALLAIGRYGDAPDRVRARDYLARASVGTVEPAERPALALFDAYEAHRNGRVDEARSHARDAAAGFARLRMPLLEAEAHEVAGATEVALALYRSCGAAYDVRRLAAEAPIDSPTFAAPDGAVSLSPREREIASLANRGLSNLEIARELSISHKTVEKHLASVFGKLGITSRRQLRA